MLSTRKVRCLNALVVLPTRDLALQVKKVFDAIAPVVGMSVGLAVDQSSIADEVSDLIEKSKQELYPTLDEEYVQMEPQTKVDILVATPGRLLGHINMTKVFILEHLQYLVKTFDKMLMADNPSCSLRSLPEESIETLHPIFASALKKLEESPESEAAKKSKSGDKIQSASKRKRTIQT